MGSGSLAAMAVFESRYVEDMEEEEDTLDPGNELGL
jgi:20S proteasome alpha/beta subunit